MASESKKFLLFKTLIAVGFALSIVLLFQTISTYKYVAGELMMQEAERDTQRKVNTLVGAVRTAQTQDMELIGDSPGVSRGLEPAGRLGPHCRRHGHAARLCRSRPN